MLPPALPFELAAPVCPRGKSRSVRSARTPHKGPQHHRVWRAQVPPSALPPLSDMVAQEAAPDEEEAEEEEEAVAVELPPPTLPAELDVPDAVRSAVEQQLAEQVGARSQILVFI